MVFYQYDVNKIGLNLQMKKKATPRIYIELTALWGNDDVDSTIRISRRRWKNIQRLDEMEAILGHLSEFIEKERVDLVLVPALAIDAQGHRIGWGKGFYDQLLAGEAAGAVRVGYVYDFQLLAECPVMPHDVPVQWVVTDTRAFSVDPLPAQ